MSQYPKLNFPAIRLRARQLDGRPLVWDELRRMWIVLTPEEWVRRHLIAYLEHTCGVVPQTIVLEYPVNLNGQAQRADVVVVDSKLQPLILCECKAPDVRIDAKVLDQAVRYNSVLCARYLILTNGLHHFCYELRAGEYVVCDHFPKIA
jgi:hypothetical protein